MKNAKEFLFYKTKELISRRAVYKRTVTISNKGMIPWLSLSRHEG